MVSLPIFDRSGNQVGQYEFDLEQFAPRISKQLLHDVVVMYQANLRQGTHKTKTRSEVAGSTRKMYRQKGTGNARAGSRRSGVRRGGGHMKTILPRDYRIRLPRKALQVATRMALASKIADGQLTVVDELSFQNPRTKDMAGVLQSLGLKGSTTLIAIAGYDLNVYKSARNLPQVTVSPVAELNAWSVLRPSRLLVTRAALDAIRDRKAASPQAVAEPV